MTRVAVSERMLQWAVTRSGRSPDAIAKRFPLKEWLRGEKQPTLRQLEAFAAYVRAPLGFMFLDEPPSEELSIPFFRTSDDLEPATGSPELIDTVYALRQRQAWVRDHLINLGYSPLPFVGEAGIGDDPVRVATLMRRALGLSDDWAAPYPSWEEALRRLREAMDAAGIFVVVNGIVGNNPHRPLNPDEFRGFVLVDEYAPFVFVNGADARSAQMFTLAHELAHILFGFSAVFDLRDLHPSRDRSEKQCNKAAAEFLVPARRLMEVWPNARETGSPLRTLARRFKVSPIVVARRLLDLGLIGRREFLDFYRQDVSTSKHRNSDTAGGDFYKNQNLRVGARFFSHVLAALYQGMISYTEAYRLTGLRGEAFHEYAQRVMEGAAAT